MKKIVDKFINVITSMRFKVFVITFIAIIIPVIVSNFLIGRWRSITIQNKDLKNLKHKIIYLETVY